MVPDRYDLITVDSLRNRMLETISNVFDKRQGSVIWDPLSATSIELKYLYIELDTAIRNSYADTADREHLILLAKERGIEPKPATFAKLKATFNIDVKIGDRFSYEELNYIVEEQISQNHEYILRCEKSGSRGNKYTQGKLIPISNITGLQSAVLNEILIPGEDEEETDTFRERYMETLRHEAYGGNISDYKKKVNALDGVGGVKVYPVWQGGGTVKIVFIDSEYNVPTPEMVEKVQEVIDPVPLHQQGVGIAPIGHYVTVEGATEDIIPIKLNLVFQDGHTWASVQANVTQVLQSYFSDLRKSWGSKKAVPGDLEEPVTVRVSQIETRILDVTGIKDISDTQIHGQTRNYTVDQNKLPKLGVISV